MNDNDKRSEHDVKKHQLIKLTSLLNQPPKPSR